MHLVLLLISSCEVFILALGQELDLFHDLFDNYDPAIRPQDQPGYITNATIYPTIFYLLAINELEQSIRFSIDLTIQWIDPVLTWKPSDRQNRTYLKVPEAFIWQPDLAIFSSLSTVDLIPFERRLVTISNNGSITKSGPQVVTNPCTVKVLNFPFDEQICEFTIGPWNYINTEVRMVLPQQEYTDSDDFLGNTEWTFNGLTTVKRVDKTYEEGDYDEIWFILHLKRKSTYYVLVLVAPTFTCSTLCIFGLFIPTDTSGYRIEKASLGVASLLAMALIMDTVTGSMPKSSELPLLGVYVLCEILICTFAMIVTCMYAILHERATTRGWMVPRWVHKIFLRRTYDRKVKQADAGFQAEGPIERESFLSPYVSRISASLHSLLSDERLESIWARIFDRIDILTMIVFQVVNVITTLVMLL